MSGTRSDMFRITGSDDGGLCVVLSGTWSIRQGLPPLEAALARLQTAPNITTAFFDCTALAGRDSGLLIPLVKIAGICSARTITLDTSGLPAGLQRLLALSTKPSGRADSQVTGVRDPFLARIGDSFLRLLNGVRETLSFIGEIALALAAELGTMQVNEEIDALRTMGISPVEFLVLPRMIALVVMMPLLCIYAILWECSEDSLSASACSTSDSSNTTTRRWPRSA